LKKRDAPLTIRASYSNNVKPAAAAAEAAAAEAAAAEAAVTIILCARVRRGALIANVYLYSDDSQVCTMQKEQQTSC
jgi:hypothetical protein